jgi:ABC-type transporter Mla maintaining outer membrane lipid asymmetry permease subunit MlaE
MKKVILLVIMLITLFSNSVFAETNYEQLGDTKISRFENDYYNFSSTRASAYYLKAILIELKEIKKELKEKYTKDNKVEVK